MRHSLRALLSLLAIYVTFVAFFLVLQRPLFILYNQGVVGGLPGWHDWWDIYLHGLYTDFAAAAYLDAIPLFLLLPGFFGRHCRWTRLALKIYLVLASVVVALIAVGDTCMYAFWEFKLDRTVLFYITDPKNAVASVSAGFVLLRALLWAAMAGALAWMLIKAMPAVPETPEIPAIPETSERPWRSLMRKGLLSLLLFLACGGLLFVAMRGLKARPNTPERTFFSNVQFYNHAALNPCFGFMYSLSKNEVDAERWHCMDDIECEALMTDMFPHHSDSTEVLLRVERPNILLLILEGFGSRFIPELGGDERVGVRLSEIARESVVFDSCYCGSFSTDRGIVCALSGYLGQPTTTVIRYTHKIRHMASLPRTLRENGYTTHALYAGDATYFNIAEYLHSAGHDEVVSQEDFPVEARSSQWGVPDGVALDWLYQTMKKEQTVRDIQSAPPFFWSVLTLSSHHPFDVPDYHRLPEERENSFAYTDSCVGRLVDRLRVLPLWDNLLVAIVADHAYNDQGLDRPDFPFIPMILAGGAIREPRRIHRLVSQTDLPATLLGQLGIAHDDFVFSRDVMGNAYRYPFGFNTFPNGFNLRDTTGCTVFSNDFGHALYGADPQRELRGKAIQQALYKNISAL